MIFDLYGTLIDIRTKEREPFVWETLARFLRYRGVPVAAAPLSEAYFAAVKQANRHNSERYPEFHVVRTFQEILSPSSHPAEFYVELAQLFRVLTIHRFGLFPEAMTTLQALQTNVRIGLISDAQRVYLEPELIETGLSPFFDVVVVSSDHGFRKPDPRLFEMALEALAVSPAEAWYVGDNPARDVAGALGAGLTAVWIRRTRRTPPPPPEFPPTYIIRSLTELVRLLPPKGEERQAGRF